MSQVASAGALDGLINRVFRGKPGPFAEEVLTVWVGGEALFRA